MFPILDHRKVPKVFRESRKHYSIQLMLSLSALVCIPHFLLAAKQVRTKDPLKSKRKEHMVIAGKNCEKRKGRVLEILD